MRLLLPCATLTLLIAACGGNPPAEQNTAMDNGVAAAPVVPPEVDEAMNAGMPNAVVPAEAATAESYVGRWIGVEGMYLNITAAGGDRVKLEMQYDLDNKQTADGQVTPEGISFTRDGKPLVLKPSDGDATGLKWLAGKKDCLTVASGEGYCRA